MLSGFQARATSDHATLAPKKCCRGEASADELN
jgi:hypothetical protein